MLSAEITKILPGSTFCYWIRLDFPDVVLLEEFQKIWEFPSVLRLFCFLKKFAQFLRILMLSFSNNLKIFDDPDVLLLKQLKESWRTLEVLFL